MTLLGIKAQTRITNAIVYIVLTAGSVLVLAPLVWMVSTSLKPLPQLSAWPPQWIPNPFVWSNYPEALNFIPFFTYLRNTMLIVVISTVGSVLSSSLVAYGFARLRFKGRSVLFVVLISTIMLPGMVVLIPMYMLFLRLGWVNTFLPLTVPAFFGNPLFIFLLRQFFMTIPLELSDAARIDGCSEFAIWWRIMLPLSKPALAVLAIFSFQAAWNDFLGPLIYLNDDSKRTLALGLYYFMTIQGTTFWNQMMAMATLMVTPILILFALFQRYFIQGITLTGMKN